VALAGQYFDHEGVLLEEHYGKFDRVLDELRRLDDRAVVYSDVLEFLDRENEITEGRLSSAGCWPACGAIRTPPRGP